jgi:class 3 adenylate cyclase
VLGNFDNATFSKDGVTTTFLRRDGKFFVATAGPDGRPGEFEVAFTLGVAPLQQYLVEMPGGRLQAFGIAWDTRPTAAGGQRWFDLYPGQKLPAGDPLHWTGIQQTANFMCIDCHVTNLRKNFDLTANAYKSSWSELGVGCEACHGPGAGHVAWARGGESRNEPGRGLVARFPGRSDIVWGTDPATRPRVPVPVAGEGRIFFSTSSEQEGEVHSSDPFFVEGRDHTFIQPVYQAADTRLPTLTVATPLTGRNGEPLGVLAAQIRVPVLVDIVSQRGGLGQTGESYLVDTGHRFLSMARFGEQAYPDGAHSLGIDTAIKGQSGAGLYLNYAGQAVIGSYRWLPDLGLALLTEIRVSEALQPATRLGWLMLLLGLLAVALLLLGTYFIARQIARPILAVNATTRQIAAGDLHVRAPVLTEDETGVLAQNFNTMIDRLEETLADLAAEQEKSDHLLLNILPAPIAARLKQGEGTIADSFAEVTILFADIVNFTPMSADLPAVELVSLLNEIFSEFDRLSEQLGLEKIKTIGDAYMVGAGLPVERKDHARVVAEMALDMLDAIERFNRRHRSDLHMRIGINTGPVVAGVIGTRKFIYDIWGDAVNIASRMESQGVEGCIQVTENTWKHLQHDYLFEDRGLISIKGKGRMRTYMLRGRKHREPSIAGMD